MNGRRIAIVVIAAAHYWITIAMFGTAGELIREMLRDPDPEKFGGFALLMLGIMFTLPGTIILGVMGIVGLEGPFSDRAALVLGSLVWGYLFVWFWNSFLKPGKRRF